MKRIPLFSVIALFIVAFSTGCEKVIDVDLNEADPKLVVEAYLTDEPGSAVVTLSRSTSYFEEQTAQMVIDAQVTITDDQGVVTTLAESSPGVYRNDNLVGVPGRIYTLEVRTGSETVTGTGEMAPPVAVDSLVQQAVAVPFGGGQSDFTLIRCHYNDPAGTENYYRPVLSVNGTPTTDISVFDDRANDGISTAVPVFAEDLTPGDTVEISLWSIDRLNYYYYNGLADNLGDGPGGSAAPGNPDTNLSGDVLGIFTVASTSKGSLVVR